MSGIFNFFSIVQAVSEIDPGRLAAGAIVGSLAAVSGMAAARILMSPDKEEDSLILDRSALGQAGAILARTHEHLSPERDDLTAILLGAILVALASIAGPAAMLVAAMLVFAGVIDFSTGYLPRVATYPILMAGIAASYLGFWEIPIRDAMLGSALGFATTAGTSLVFRFTMDMEDSPLGGGDIFLITAMGAWCGIGWVMLFLFMGAVFGLVGGLVGRLFGNDDPVVRLGPYLALAGIAALALIESGKAESLALWADHLLFM